MTDHPPPGKVTSVLVEPDLTSKLLQLNLTHDQVREVIAAVRKIGPDAGEALGHASSVGKLGYRVITAGPGSPAVIYRPQTNDVGDRVYLVTDVWTPEVWKTYQLGSQIRRQAVEAAAET